MKYKVLSELSFRRKLVIFKTPSNANQVGDFESKELLHFNLAAMGFPNSLQLYEKVPTE